MRILLVGFAIGGAVLGSTFEMKTHVVEQAIEHALSPKDHGSMGRAYGDCSRPELYTSYCGPAPCYVAGDFDAEQKVKSGWNPKC